MPWPISGFFATMNIGAIRRDTHVGIQRGSRLEGAALTGGERGRMEKSSIETAADGSRCREERAARQPASS